MVSTSIPQAVSGASVAATIFSHCLQIDSVCTRKRALRMFVLVGYGRLLTTALARDDACTACGSFHTNCVRRAPY